jgi:hypothetical protein
MKDHEVHLTVTLSPQKVHFEGRQKVHENPVCVLTGS